MKQVVQTINKHLWGILNASALNGERWPGKEHQHRNQKPRSPDKGRFANVIHFYLGGLDLQRATALE
jgi:hypothetical protein